MKLLSALPLVLAASLVVATAQQPHSNLSFEVASIRPGADADAEMIAIRMNAESSRIHYVNVSLRDMIRVAYRVKEFQVSGPDWIRNRFNIEAKYPAGATEDQVPEMLQSLLRDRFKLQLHSEEKEHAVFALVVSKNGPQLKASQVKATDFPDSPNRKPGTPVHGDIQIMGSPTGMHLKGPSITLSRLCETLSMFVDQPVVDQTGLKERYDIDLTFMPENMRMRGGPGGPGQGSDGGTDTHTERVTLFQAVQDLGLKLEPRKAPLQMLIVDHVEKAPTEN